ncbi:hypothetical protein E2320_003939, partial [Naja naja]
MERKGRTLEGSGAAGISDGSRWRFSDGRITPENKYFSWKFQINDTLHKLRFSRLFASIARVKAANAFASLHTSWKALLPPSSPGTPYNSTLQQTQ